MNIESKWHTFFEGSGSVTGNAWLEKVCYLGEERWLLGLCDDVAWSLGDLVIQEPEQLTSAELAAWASDMDVTDQDYDLPRVNALLEIAVGVGAIKLEAELRALIQDCADDY
jgi:hypothetical protein